MHPLYKREIPVSVSWWVVSSFILEASTWLIMSCYIFTVSRIVLGLTFSFFLSLTMSCCVTASLYTLWYCASSLKNVLYITFLLFPLLAGKNDKALRNNKLILTTNPQGLAGGLALLMVTSLKAAKIPQPSRDILLMFQPIKQILARSPSK